MAQLTQASYWFQKAFLGRKISSMLRGQLISEGNFGVFKFPKECTKFLDGFLPLPPNWVHFWQDLKTPKFPYESNWPLVIPVVIHWISSRSLFLTISKQIQFYKKSHRIIFSKSLKLSDEFKTASANMLYSLYSFFS